MPGRPELTTTHATQPRACETLAPKRPPIFTPPSARRVEGQTLAEPLQQAAPGEEFTPALVGAEARVAPAVEWAQPASRARQRLRAEVGDARRRYPGLPCHRRKTRLALVPPKPRLLLITASSEAARVLSTIGRPRIAGSGSSRLAQAAMKPCSIISRQ